MRKENKHENVERGVLAAQTGLTYSVGSFWTNGNSYGTY